jgi:hypothetical protein
MSDSSKVVNSNGVYKQVFASAVGSTYLWVTNMINMHILTCYCRHNSHYDS